MHNIRRNPTLISAHSRVPSQLRSLQFMTSSVCTVRHGSTTPGKVKVTLKTQKWEEADTEARAKLKKGAPIVVEVPVGSNLMEITRDVAKMEIEAACDGTCACSTCHMYVDENTFEKLPEMSDDEHDMLDMVDDFREGSSRLACQCVVTAEMNGMEATLPKSATSVI